MRSLSVIAFVFVPTLVLARGPFEPNPEFAPGNVNPSELIDPATSVVFEPETVADSAKGWRPVPSKWLRTGCTGGQALIMGGDGRPVIEKEESVCIDRGKDGKRCLTAYGDIESKIKLRKRTDYETKRKAANHSHY